MLCKQPRDDLQLVVLYAAETIEEAEAANIKLCGKFFRQYLDPLSIPFQRRAVEASLSSRTAQKRVAPKRGQSCRGAVAAAFHRQVHTRWGFKGARTAGKPSSNRSAGRLHKAFRWIGRWYREMGGGRAFFGANGISVLILDSEGVREGIMGEIMVTSRRGNSGWECLGARPCVCARARARVCVRACVRLRAFVYVRGHIKEGTCLVRS